MERSLSRMHLRLGSGERSEFYARKAHERMAAMKTVRAFSSRAGLRARGGLALRGAVFFPFSFLLFSSFLLFHFFLFSFLTRARARVGAGHVVFEGEQRCAQY